MDKAKEYTKPPIWVGALIGAVFTPALMAIMYLGEAFASLPFAPFDLFNWIARVMPGQLITFGIDRMIDILLLLGQGANLDQTAKTAEEMMGLAVFWGMGIVAGAVFFFVMNRWVNISNVNLAGIALGLAFGLPLQLVISTVNVSSSASEIVQIVWTVLLFLGWGMVIAWAYTMLAMFSNATEENPEISAQGIDRRQFLVRVGGASATLTVIGAGLGAVLRNGPGQGVPAAIALDATQATTDGAGNPLPNVDALVQAVPGTRQEYTPIPDFYRIDILSGGLPSIPEDYTLPVTGLIANEVDWTLDEIKELPATEAFLTMSCISNRIAGSLISTTKWTGVSFQEILEIVQPDENAVAIKIVGYDDFDEYVSLDMIREDDRIMLAYYFNDEPLPLRNGFPLRIHIPDRYGMKQPKWIRSMEFVSEHEPGYWVRRGWSRDAIVNAVSVIDTVSTQSAYQQDGSWVIPVGGMAWAGDRGISKVEISIDGGEWVEADLRDPLSQRSWTIWRYEWPFEEGPHTFAVRAYEADGTLQPTATRGTRPDGATGIHEVDEIVMEPTPAEPADA